MIRKPQPDWHRLDEGAAVRTVRTAAAVATGSARLARRGGAAAAGLFCFAIAIFWGFQAIAGSIPNFIGTGAMAAFVAWVGYRLFAKALATSD
jgi:hypothetical protein